MDDKVVLAEHTCPWCGTPISIMEAMNSKVPYANCGLCNAHFSKIPLGKLHIDKKEEEKDAERTKGALSEVPA